MLGFTKRTPQYSSEGSHTNLSLDGSGKANHSGQRLWRFMWNQSQAHVGTEVTISGRRARIVESSDDGGYVEFL
jgi:hypothetical protein